MEAAARNSSARPSPSYFATTGCFNSVESKASTVGSSSFVLNAARLCSAPGSLDRAKRLSFAISVSTKFVQVFNKGALCKESLSIQ
mmetsp:Transcript_5373/g.7566  ORF Transcript_5373/g.7566 Transcript_5373/m.7566 type:complete len:86 (+) Transcript_5373:273-530(+)